MKGIVRSSALGVMVLVAAVWVPVAAQQAADTAPTTGVDCGEKLAGLALPGHAVRLTEARRVAHAPPGTVRPLPFLPPVGVAIPGYCRVRAVIDQRKGVDDVEYGLKLELALPDRRLPLQGHSLELDSRRVCGLGMKVKGGTRPRLSCGRSSLYSRSQVSVISRTSSIASNT